MRCDAFRAIEMQKVTWCKINDIKRIRKRNNIFANRNIWKILSRGTLEVYLYVEISTCFYSHPRTAGSTSTELFKGTELSLQAQVWYQSRRIRRLFEISKNREKAKRWDRIERSGDAKGQVQLEPVVIFHGGACTATERREDTIYIFILRGRSHRLDGRRRDALWSAAKIADALRVSSVIESSWSASLWERRPKRNERVNA